MIYINYILSSESTILPGAYLITGNLKLGASLIPAEEFPIIKAL